MGAARWLIAILSLFIAAQIVQAAGFPTLNGAKPLVIGHRGASGYLPEHTLEAYRTAIAQGADFIEPDLVSTKDGQLIARHEPDLTNTTNVGKLPQFANRKRTVVIDSVTYTGWFSVDFTLAEIKQLRAVQSRGGRSTTFDGAFEVPTFQEVIDLAKRESARLGRTIGVYPETKHATWHRQVGLPIEEKLVPMLEAAGWRNKADPVIIQSFEIGNLKQLRPMTGVRLVQLLSAYDNDIHTGRPIYLPKDPDSAPWDWISTNDPRSYADMTTKAGLAEIATYADGIGPWKRQFVGVKGLDRNGDNKADDVNDDGAINEADGVTQVFSTLIADAHAAGLVVHAYTFRNDVPLARDFAGEAAQEYRQLFALGLDGVFSDFPDTAFDARERLAAGKVSAIEFTVPGTQRYFRTIVQSEQAVVASGILGNWQSTSDRVNVWQSATDNAGARPVCRVFDPVTGRHSYSIVESECQAFRAQAGAVDEGIAFFVVPVDADGQCPASTLAIDRLRIGSGNVAYERYVGAAAESARLVASGWTRVGIGFCGAP